MKFISAASARADWKKLRSPAIAFLVALLLMAASVYFAKTKKDAAVEALQNQKIQLQQATQRYQSSGAEKNNIIKYLPQYQALISKGVVGEERRLEWIDALRTIHKNQKLFSIKYIIGVQEPYKPAFSLNAGQFKITRSMMKFELAMLHEGDLLTLLDGLTAEQSAPFIVRQCEMTRQNANIGSSLTPNIQTKCELDWITIHEPIAATAVLLTPNKTEAEAP